MNFQNVKMAELNSKYIHIRNYQLNQQPIGRGTFGTIYQGTDTNTGAEVAMKKVDADEQTAIENLKSLHNVMSHGHTNIVKLLNFFDDESIFWFVMEFCNLQDLSRYMRNQTIDLNAKMRLMLDASSGLAHMHGMTPKVVHRDIKPTNILIKLQDGRPVAKLGGFCLAIQFDSDTKNFAMGEVGGTLPYIAPEGFQKGTIEYYPSVDIFALGLVISSMVLHEQYGNLNPRCGMFIFNNQI